MKNKSLISITDYSKEEYLRILSLAEEFEKEPNQRIAEGKVVASLFFEPSTRTRLSFESAINRLGAKVVGFADTNTSSGTKGESMVDTIKTVSCYVDLIVMRHSLEGAARLASEVASVPIINGGDGSNQHPTQCLLDLYSIKKTQGTLDNLDIALVGDLKYGRTIHSLAIAMSNFNTTFHLVSPESLKLPSSVKMYIKERNLKYYQYTEIQDAVDKVDILYMSRVQRERFLDIQDYEKVKNSCILDKSLLANVKSSMKVLHPLPRVNEININVDSTPYAYYFQQAKNGVFVRQALIALILGLK
ncbi:MAG: aspartate carbamoyltransferase [Bacteroidales bacterium]|jgi:aspartate carbamoyltransferase catalytic subunit|nr:aspartate carbamoyltransferase [Bacteroidales bacterium]HON21281.1 aspartate carbamoyltransferase [Bacteroidales bacterium]HPJ91992.1 aspartate carbamoyltransferase [Bacteroidales bacterium]HPX59578.1 aspartate carbamoyltransferase [Bacteroidales bacterium]